MSSPEVKIILSMIDQTKEGLASAGLNVKNYANTVEQESRKIRVSWKDAATSISGVITAGFALYAMYESVYKQQIMVMRLTNSLEDAQRRQNNALDKLNEAIAKHGANSQEAAKAQEAYDAASKDVAVIQERLTYAQNNYNEAILRAVTFVIPSMITMVDRGKVAYDQLKISIDAVAAGQASLATTTVAAAGVIGIAAAATGAMYFAFEKLAEYLYDVSDAEEKLQEETLRSAKVFESLDAQLKGIEDALPDVQKQVDELTEVFVTGADKVEKSFFDVFTVETKEFQDDLTTTAKLVEDFLSGIEPAFGSVSVIIQAFADEWGLTWDEAEKIVMQKVASIRGTLEEEIGAIKDSFFGIFTEESEGFQVDLQGMGQAVYEALSGMEPDFTSARDMIQEFADRWGLTWNEAESIVMDAVEEIKATVGTVAPTLEEELVGKAQAAMERFKECMGEKSTATREDVRDAMEDLVSSVNELISHGLLGEAQALMDQFKEAEPDKMWKMTEEIDSAIESLTTEMESEYEKMLAAADELSGEERGLMIQRAEEMRDEYLARIEQLKEWKAQILFRMQLETQGYMDAEISTIMSSLTTLQSLSGGKWEDIVALWEICLKGAEGDIATALAAIQAEIDKLRGKEITITTTYVTRYVTEGGERIPYYTGTTAATGTTTKTTQEPYKTPPSLPPSIRQMGLEYVPYTGYLAMLHRGEAILTEQQAESWRRGYGRGFGDIIINIANVALSSDMDIRETARKLARYVAQEERRQGLD